MGARTTRRRLLAAFVAFPLAAALPGRAADRPKVVGYLSGGQGPEWLAKVLASRGYVEGRNLRIVTRIPPSWEPEELARAARELVAARPDALYALMANRVGALAAATRTIPIVTGGVPDPVGAGFAKSLRQPGGNVTGLSFGLPETAEVVIGILKAIRPRLARVGGLFTAGLPPAHMGSWFAEPCRKAGLEWRPEGIVTLEDAERILASMAGQAVVLAPLKDVELGHRIAGAAVRHRVATVGGVEGGALMNYGLDFANQEERIAAVMDKVLRGGDPAHIPFELPDRPSFEWNRAAAKSLAIELPRDVALRVTRYVE
jgi:putative ABC transport system substrate-binding protein